MENQDSDILPSYDDVVRENRLTRERKLSFLYNVMFIVIDIFLTCCFLAVFITIRLTDTFDVHMTNATKLCNDISYNRINYLPQRDYTLAYGVITCAFLITAAMLFTQTIIDKCNMGIMMIHAIWRSWVLGTHLMCLSILVDLLKISFGVLRPCFFYNKDIKFFYCESASNDDRTMPLGLKKLDVDLRMSFPSYRSTMYGFCVSFIYLYLGHFDVKIGIHATQQSIILLLIYYISHSMFDIWQDGENHLTDILIGAVIGIIQGTITIRSMFGSVFWKNSATSQINTLDNNSPATPVEQLTYRDVNSAQWQNDHNLELLRAHHVYDPSIDVLPSAPAYTANAPLLETEHITSI